MRSFQALETRRDRRALARDAGLGPFSALSVLAGALCGLAAFEVLAAIGGAVAVAVHGSTNFGGWSTADVKTVAGVILGVSVALSFLFGGYISGRMSRRQGATHGALSGVVGVILTAVVTAAIITSGTDTALTSVARHLNVADTWQQWRDFGLVGALIAIAAVIVVGAGGAMAGERWHGKLLARAIDPTFGPEAEEREAARRHASEAEAARLAGAAHVGRQTAVLRATGDSRTKVPVEGTVSGRADGPGPVRAGESVPSGNGAPVVARDEARGDHRPPIEQTAPIMMAGGPPAREDREGSTDDGRAERDEAHGGRIRHLLHR